MSFLSTIVTVAFLFIFSAPNASARLIETPSIVDGVQPNVGLSTSDNGIMGGHDIVKRELCSLSYLCPGSGPPGEAKPQDGERQRLLDGPVPPNFDQDEEQNDFEEVNDTGKDDFRRGQRHLSHPHH